MEIATGRSRTLAYLALSAALMAVCSWMTVPVPPVPFTMQTFAVFAVLGLLGGRLGSAAICCYLGLGLVGLPVFAGFTGGPGIFFGPTGGYLVGFLLMGLCYWALTARFGEGKAVRTLALLLGLLLLYGFGSVWFYLVYLKSGGMGFAAILGYCVLPFVLPDGLKLALALVVTERVRPQIRR